MPVIDDALPTWLKIATGCAFMLAWLWALLVGVVRPWNDERWYGAFERQSAKVEKHLREKTFERDLDDADARDHRIDALEDAMKGIAAAQLAQGELLKEIPHLSNVLGKLDGTLQKVDSTLVKLEVKVDVVAEGHSKLSGMIEAWRDSDNAPIRPRRKRTQ